MGYYAWLLALMVPVWTGLLAVLGAYGVMWTVRSRAWLVFRVCTLGFVLLMAALFVTGIYFYASGNAYHELASFLLNQYCDIKNVTGSLCKGMFFNDYYVGNGLYFVGAFLMTIIPILFEVAHPRFLMKRSDFFLLIPNVLFYALAIIAYAGFDRVLVGLVYSLFTMLFVLVIILIHRKEAKRLPVTNYTALIYVIGTAVACIVRFLH